MKRLLKFKASDQTEERSAEEQLARDNPVKESKMDKASQVDS